MQSKGKKQPGCAGFSVAVVLIIISSIIFAAYPVLQKLISGITSQFDSFRGVYAGPVLMETPENIAIDTFEPGSFQQKGILVEDGIRVGFIPAANQTYEIYIATEYNGLAVVELYTKTGTLVATNRTSQWGNPRARDMYSQMGREIPPHGYHLEADLEKGKYYIAVATPISPQDEGTEFKMNIGIVDTSLPLELFWGAFVVSVIVLLFGFNVLLWYSRRKKKA